VKTHWSKKLAVLGACREAIVYAKTKPSLAAAWRDCERADWMLWLLGKITANRAPETPARRKLAGCAGECAATILRYLPEDEKRPAKCIRLVRRWAGGDPRVTIGMLQDAASAASAAYYAYYAPIVSAVSVAHCSADSAASTADYAACAAELAAYACDAYAAAKQRALARMARIVRRNYPTAPRLRGKKAAKDE
jgi:hypothetical protein